MLESQVVFEPPNGGFGWIVVFGAILINIFNKSFLLVFGLLFGPFFESINVSQSDISLVMSFASFFGSISGLFTGALMKKFSYRQVSVFACFITSLGLTLSAFSTSILQVILTYSVFTGTGFGLLASSTLIAVTSYFTTKKKMAVSFSTAGTGVGQIILPQVVKYLNNVYPSKTSILIMGTMMLNGVFGAMLFRPVKRYLVPRVVNETDYLKSAFRRSFTSIRDDNQSIWDKFVHSMDLSLLKDLHFWSLNFVLACGYAVFIDVNLIMPAFLQTTISKDQTAMCLSILAAFDLLSRLTFHFITDRTSFTSRQILVFGIIVLGVLKTTMTFITSYNYMLIVCSVYGYFRAVVLVNQVLSLSEHCAKYYPERFPGALGLNLVFNGFAVLIFGRMFGLFRDKFSDYSYTFYFHDAFVMFILFIWLIEYLYQIFKRN